MLLSDPEAIRAALEGARNIAILGARRTRSAAGFYVPEYLQSVGYRILPVNPGLAGQTFLGEPAYATLAEVEAPFDFVNVFRRPEFLPAHAEEILALPTLPKVVWFQLGIRHDGAATRLSDAGIDVVQDRCTLADHRRWRLSPIPA